MAKDTLTLWPREHGAYAQLSVALLCSLALGFSSRGIAQAVLTVTLFLASEPVLVLLGRRGEADHSFLVRAALRLVILGSLAILGAIMAWVGAPAGHFLSLFPPALLGAFLFILFLLRLERSATGELVAAWTFSAAAGAVALFGGAGLHRSNLLVLILAGMFSLATAIVHCHLSALRRGGAWLPRAAAFFLGLALCAVAWGLARHGRLLLGSVGAFVPLTLAALKIWLSPPSPRDLRAVGWAATACAVAGGALAVFGLH